MLAFATVSGLRAQAGLAAILLLPALAQAADPVHLAALDQLTPGGWDIRYRPDNTRQQICLRNGRDLIQLRHPGAACSRHIVEDAADRVTVHYTCPGHGYGRTQIRRESSGLVQIESQGIVDKLPFQFSAEARRTGRCRD